MITPTIENIPLTKLIVSDANVRHGKGQRIDELAASIAAHGLLQNLTVRKTPTKRFEVVAGGRRLAALRLLAKQQRIEANTPVACHVLDDENVTEISLAENVGQAAMHPADQYEAFRKLHEDDNMPAEDIAARFGVSLDTVQQRLKLGAVSPKLVALYRDGEMNLDQLTAFTVTDDHARQEQVWDDAGYANSRRDLLAALTDDQLSTHDRRAAFVGLDGYVAAGGTITRDLFDEEGGGFINDAGLLFRLFNGKLELAAADVRAEGWKWVEVMAEYDYSATSNMRRVYPEAPALSETDHARMDELEAQYRSLEEDEDAEPETLEKIEAAIDAIQQGEETYQPEQLAIAGAIVTLSGKGELRIERGFVRREDEPKREKGASPTKDPAALSASLVAALSAERTAALSNEVIRHPEVALIAVIHALALRAFFGHDEGYSCLMIDAREPQLGTAGGEVEESGGVIASAAMSDQWRERLPTSPELLWEAVVGLSADDRLELLAYCVSRSVNALSTGFNANNRAVHANQLAKAVSLDMTAYWQPTAANYLGRVSKAHIAAAVREAVSPEAAQAIADLKKGAMADRAEKLLAGKNWLPEVLRG